MKHANAVFNTPGNLRLNEEVRVQLLVSRRQSIATLQSQVTELGEIEGKEIKVSRFLEATLTGLHFDIVPVTKLTQPVAEEGVTTWEWTVEPTKAGRRALTLTLHAKVRVGDREADLTLSPIYRKTWTVDVTFSARLSGFIQENWQWLWTTFLVPVLALTWRRIRVSGARH